MWPPVVHPICIDAYHVDGADYVFHYEGKCVVCRLLVAEKEIMQIPSEIDSSCIKRPISLLVDERI